MPLLPAAATGGMYNVCCHERTQYICCLACFVSVSCEIRIRSLLVQTASWSGLVRWYPSMKYQFVNDGILSKLVCLKQAAKTVTFLGEFVLQECSKSVFKSVQQPQILLP